MARINPKTGLPYVTGVKFSEQDSWRVTVKEAFDAIRNDPDLTRAEKVQAVKQLRSYLDQMLKINDTKERMKLLNQLYKKAHGVNANQTTPMAEFVRKAILRRDKF